MKYDSHFDVDAALRTIESISHGFQARSAEEASLRAAAAALVYVREIGYQVVNLPPGARFLRNPLPQELEK
jgi:hypothetical protein